MKFHLDLNLDDEQEVRLFVERYSNMFPDDVARCLEISDGGTPAVYLAFDLQAYADYKVKAIDRRLAGSINTAMHYERVCDLIYKRIIEVCECW